MSSAPKMPKTLPSTYGDISIGQGGHGDLVSITFTMTLTPEQCDQQLSGRWRGLKHGLVGGTTVVLPTVKAILEDNEDMPSSQIFSASSTLLVAFHNDVLKPLVEAKNPQLAMEAELEEARAKAKAYDLLVAKLAEDEAKKKATQLLKTQKMLATKASQKAQAVAPVPEAPENVMVVVPQPPVAKKVIKTVKAKAPPLAPEEVK
jgi:hypothetical protein